VQQQFKRHVEDCLTPGRKKCSSFALWEKHDGNITSEQVQEVGPRASRTQLRARAPQARDAPRDPGVPRVNTAHPKPQNEQWLACECGAKDLTRNQGRQFKSRAHTPWAATAQTEV
jgi:hypothetical protein